jgi:hypothetical protein
VRAVSGVPLHIVSTTVLLPHRITKQPQSVPLRNCIADCIALSSLYGAGTGAGVGDGTGSVWEQSGDVALLDMHLAALLMFLTWEARAQVQ